MQHKLTSAFVAVVLSGTAALAVSAANTDATSAPAPATTAPAVSADSCATAFATIMAQYLAPELNRQFPADTAAVTQFSAGVAHAFEVKNSTAPFFLGARNGFALIDRVEAMIAMGYPFTTEQFCAALDQALRGNTMGFDPAAADNYLRDAMNTIAASNAPQPLSPESQQQFLNEQKQRPGVEQLASGLLFEIITEGEGTSPGDADEVNVTYTGSLADGTVFDSTDRPVKFPVGNLVPGFTEGLKLMKPGGTYRIIIPPALGYGDKGAGGVIPPGAALDFTITLHDVITHNK
jgi:FKBP-type peptidyl-prolyl cis-trans isomerase